MARRSPDDVIAEVDARIPWQDRSIRFWHDIPTASPEFVAGRVEDLVRRGAYLCLELGEDGRDDFVRVPLSQEQRDDLLYTIRFCADGAQATAGVSYSLLHKLRRILWAVLGFLVLNTVLLILLLGTAL